LQGKMTCIDGSTQIRAGVQRPEIVIPLDIDEDRSGKSNDDLLLSGMKNGLPIRIIRRPYFGALGRIASLPPELQKLGSESYVRVLQADLDDGRRVTVPRANVEIIEE
ncbi:MAG: hypothetical protein QG670_2633, partial [Thermoproteota archaeon]|nr:hypothetical protein [Thermoproteota archaeon]